jgi:hypothetical protein
MVDSWVYDGENTGVMALTARTPTGMQCQSPIVDNVACRLSGACPKTHNPVCTHFGISSSATLIDPLGSALVSVWVYQETQHNARIVQEAEREARRTSFSVRVFTDNMR